MINRTVFNACIEMTKPRILSLVLVTTVLGYYLGGRGIPSFAILAYLLLGTSLVCGGSSVLNHYLESEYDGKMLRTRNRPIPSGIIKPVQALNFGILLVLSGMLLLAWKVNLLTGYLSLLTSFLYILVYTPLKRISWLNTTMGAIPGAIPPMGGWAAAAGQIDFGAWVLFAILFVWQHPHFYAIAWMFRDDYARAGFKMLPVVKPDGKRTFSQILIFSVILLPVSFLPVFLGITGAIYGFGALLLGLFLLAISRGLQSSHSIPDARKLLRATIIYLPALLFLIILDAKF